MKCARLGIGIPNHFRKISPEVTRRKEKEEASRRKKSPLRPKKIKTRKNKEGKKEFTAVPKYMRPLSFVQDPRPRMTALAAILFMRSWHADGSAHGKQLDVKHTQALPSVSEEGTSHEQNSL